MAFRLVWCVFCTVLHKWLSAAWSHAGLALPSSMLISVLPGVTWLPALPAVGSWDVQPPSLAAELWHAWVTVWPTSFSSLSLLVNDRQGPRATWACWPSAVAELFVELVAGSLIRKGHMSPSANHRQSEH